MTHSPSDPARRLDRLMRALSRPARLVQKISARFCWRRTVDAELARSSHELAHLRAQLQILQRDHAASVEWLQRTYPEIVGAVARKIEQPQLEEQVQKLFAALHRELRTVQVAATVPAAVQPAAVQPGSIASYPDPAFYLELEKNFRGTPEEIRARLLPYLPLLQGACDSKLPLIDIGCGRGEWLSLLQERQLAGRGVDLNPINGAYCRSRGLDVVTGDAVQFLQSLPAASIGAITAFHLVEHLPFPLLEELTRLALQALKPGGLLIYETPNPENLLVATRSFWIDPTHRHPLPPELLEFLVVQKGFRHLETRRLHPGPDIECVAPGLESLLCGPRDYAVIAQKPLPDAAAQ